MRRIGALRLAVVVLLLAVATTALVWVVTYREPGLQPYNGHRPGFPPASGYVVISPDWTTPLIGVIGISALGGAVLVFRRRR